MARIRFRWLDLQSGVFLTFPWYKAEVSTQMLAGQALGITGGGWASFTALCTDALSQVAEQTPCKGPASAQLQQLFVM